MYADVGATRTEDDTSRPHGVGGPSFFKIPPISQEIRPDMANPRGYRTFAEFHREALRPGMRAGWSIDELDAEDDRKELDFDLDPFEQALLDAEKDEDDYDD